MSNQVRCIRKTNRTSAHERIESIGGVNTDGGRWIRSQAQAVADILAGTYAYHVERPAGHHVKVVVATSAAGHRYIKTEADGEQPNNLLSLPECP